MTTKAKEKPSNNVRYMLAGGSVLAALGLVAEPSAMIRRGSQQDQCQQVVSSSARLSREQLSRLLSIAERSPKAKVEAIVKPPYCQLANLPVRAGSEAQRHAYPLAFDPKTWVVILYEGNEYAGYAFSLRQ